MEAAACVGSVMVSDPQSSVKPQRIRNVVLNLENCILSTERLVNTPSIQDGLDPSIESDLRFLGCEMIQSAGILLRLPQVAMATGQVLYQRFYYSKSFVAHNYEIVAMACVVLASKIEEAPRRVRDVLNVFHHLERLRRCQSSEPLILDQAYLSMKNQVIKAERRVLKELGFCVHVKHPHKVIVTLLEVILSSETNHRITQIAWNYMNDSLRSDIFVRYPPETIACACIHLAARLLQIPLPNDPPWYWAFSVTDNQIDDASNRILSLYTRPKVNVDHVEKVVQELRAKQQEEKKVKLIVISKNNGGNNVDIVGSKQSSLKSGSRESRWGVQGPGGESGRSNALSNGDVKRDSRYVNKEERGDHIASSGSHHLTTSGHSGRGESSQSQRQAQQQYSHQKERFRGSDNNSNALIGLGGERASDDRSHRERRRSDERRSTNSVNHDSSSRNTSNGLRADSTASNNHAHHGDAGERRGSCTSSGSHKKHRRRSRDRSRSRSVSPDRSRQQRSRGSGKHYSRSGSRERRRDRR